ncbi:MAG: putative Ig domain-containing protein, partial [Synergistaceae bacterium]|nr:putative Ig domain-containing protein [Synergistaceae bacterium]
FGEFTVRFVAENDAGSAQAILPLTVKGIPPKLSGRLAKAELSQPYSSGLRLSKGSTPITWSISGNLPEGVSFDTTTGIISGTPVSYSRSGFRVRITASNEAGSKTKSVRLMVKGTRPQITTASLPDAKLRRTYTASLTAEGSEPVTWSAVNLPAGLTISGDMITGTATQTGTFRVRLCAKNPVKSVRKTLTLNVSETTDTRLPVFSQYEGDSSQNAGGTSSSSYTQAYAYQTGTGNISGGYVIVGELGVISCDEAGLYEFGITLSDDAYEGSELIYIANSDSPSEDDDIADFYDETGEEISAVPEDRRIIISIWLNPGTVYHPVIAVKR